MRFAVKGFLLGCTIGLFLATSLLWSQCRPPRLPSSDQSLSDPHQQDQNRRNEAQSGRNPLMAPRWGSSGAAGEASAGMEEIDCVINQESTVPCRRDENDVYVPFSFIHNYFEVYGRVSTNKDGEEVFEWSHSYSNVFESPGQYRSLGPFLNFHLFNVEARERVKCVSGADGVPISTQWKSSGYPYPIQIAQFGLSHYSKHLEQPKAKRVILEDGSENQLKWETNSAGDLVSRVYKSYLKAHVLKFVTEGSTRDGGRRRGIAAKVPGGFASPDLVVLTAWLSLRGSENGSLSVALRTNDKKSDLFTIHYLLSDTLVAIQDQNIYYGLGSRWEGKNLTRNLLIDLQKGVNLSSKSRKLKKKINKSKLRVVWIGLCGSGEVSNLALSSHAHLRQFYHAAEWLVRNQDSRGGWPIPVQRKVIAGLLELDPGWYSAMAQGQAISVLVRAAHHSADRRFIESAEKAAALFCVNVTQGGVRTYFPGGHPWFEEYPTTPSLFVLNGFMYSLFGLFDLKSSSMTSSKMASELFDEGMRSLRLLLPLFDSGQGSFYDLRHFSGHTAPNVARWDYHTTHVTQLLALATVDPNAAQDDFLRDTATRWKEYLVGRRAKHN